MRKCLLCCLGLTVCLAFLFSVSVCAGGISVDGYIRPEEWEGAPFSTLFTSEQESGCAVSYADLRTTVDVPSRRVYFALQVVDEAVTGEGSRSRVHIRFRNAEITLSAEGSFQISESGHTVQVAGVYQSGNYNRDYVLEAAVTTPGPLPGGRLPFSIWFTDGAGYRSKSCELTIDTGIPAETTSEAQETVPSTTVPQSYAPERTTAVTPTQQDNTHISLPATGGHSTHDESGANQANKETGRFNPQKPDVSPNVHPGSGNISAGGIHSSGKTEGLPAGVEESALTSQEITIPATGETGAGYWSAKRIVACTIAGACILAAALLFVLQAHKKEKQAEAKE